MNEAERKSVFQRFVTKFLVGDGCWEWQAGLFPNGYGAIWVNGRQLGAHRVAYELFNGPIPDGLFVCHTCDNRRCVRPSHLFLGTQTDNMGDASAKGRVKGPRGEKCGNAKLRGAQVRFIRDARRAGTPVQSLARLFDINKSNVSTICRGRSWEHIDDIHREEK